MPSIIDRIKSLEARLAAKAGEISYLFVQVLRHKEIYDYGTSASGVQIKLIWSQIGNHAKVTLAQNNTLKFDLPHPVGCMRVVLFLIQGGSGSNLITNWQAAGGSAVYWPGGTAPTLSTAVGSVDIITAIYDGTNYYAQASLNFS